jgi:hypothetical protein
MTSGHLDKEKDYGSWNRNKTLVYAWYVDEGERIEIEKHIGK